MASKKRSLHKGKGSRNTSAPAGCLFWLVLLAVVVAVAVAAREPLKAAFLRFFSTKTESAREGGGAPSDPSTGPETPPTAPPAMGPEAHSDAPPAAVPQKRSPMDAPRAPLLRRARLHFIALDPDGTTRTIAVDRDLPQSDSPLHDAIVALLAGPDAREKGRGLASMIPTETRLRSATVKSRTAYLDFTESFRFTAGGVEGLAAELRQVVSTATEFPTVDKVQILIEGEKVQYLGTEGVRIDEPLSRESVAQ